MKIPDFIQSNLLLKITSVNSLVIGVRLVISFFIQRLLAETVGEAGIYKIGQLRSVTQLLSSFSSLGIFNGVVKYTAEYKEEKEQLKQLFSTTAVFTLIGTIASGVVLFIGAPYWSEQLFSTDAYTYIIKLIAIIVPFIAVQRVFNGVINGLSAYKKFGKIELISYVLSSLLTVICLLNYNLDGALVAIALTPVIQVLIMLAVFFKVLKTIIPFKEISLSTPLAKSLLAFTLMSFVSTVLLQYAIIDIRSMLANRLSEEESGIWTALTTISSNYMVFIGAILTLYVIPKFAGIYTQKDFTKELLNIYKTLLPLFGVGMLLIYFGRQLFIDYIYVGFDGMNPLFKWQLLGDFVRLASIILAHQFLAKKMVRNFIFSEILSVALFYGFTYYLTPLYGVEGVVIAHFASYIIYFMVVLFLVYRYFGNQQKADMLDKE